MHTKYQKNPEFSGYLPTGCTRSVLVYMSKKKKEEEISIIIRQETKIP